MARCFQGQGIPVKTAEEDVNLIDRIQKVKVQYVLEQLPNESSPKETVFRSAGLLWRTVPRVLLQWIQLKQFSR